MGESHVVSYEPVTVFTGNTARHLVYALRKLRPGKNLD